MWALDVLRAAGACPALRHTLNRLPCSPPLPFQTPPPRSALLLLQGVLLRRTKQSKIDGQPIIDLPKRVLSIRKACE